MKTIKFNLWSLERIRAGEKTETRRILRPQPRPTPARFAEWSPGTWAPESNSGKMFLSESWGACQCPYGPPGSSLAVTPPPGAPLPSTPPILRVVEICVETLGQITGLSCLAEGCAFSEPEKDKLVEKMAGGDPWGWNVLLQREFRGVWEGIYGEKSWSDEIWVWVIRFELQKKGDV